jgi:hypothetical protein
MAAAFREQRRDGGAAVMGCSRSAAHVFRGSARGRAPYAQRFLIEACTP